MLKTAAITPAYNEAKTIGAVIGILTGSRLIDQVIVVSDGSTDHTVQSALSHSGVSVIELLENRGKAGALSAGMEQTDAEVVLFLDADLIGLTESHVAALLQPVLTGEADMAVGIFKKGRLVTDLAQKMTPFLSGQRALKRDLLEQIPAFDCARFGAEIALSRFAEENGFPVVEVDLPDLSHLMKEEKLGLWKGIPARGKMYWEIIRYATRGNPAK